MDRLVPQVRAALLAYQQALLRLGHDVNTGVSADEAAQEAQAQVEQLQLDQAQRVRAIYMAGGQAGLITTVLESQGPADFTERLSMLDRVHVRADHAAAVGDRVSGRRQADATAGLAQADATGETAGDVQTRYQQLVALLAAAQARPGQAVARARTLAAAEAAARELAALAAAAASAGTAAAGTARGHGIPPAYLALYRAAATTCPGLDWHVLAAIGQVESGPRPQRRPVVRRRRGTHAVHAGDVRRRTPSTATATASRTSGTRPTRSSPRRTTCARTAPAHRRQAVHRDLALQPRGLVRADGAAASPPDPALEVPADPRLTRPAA